VDKSPRVSVLMTVYNAAPYLRAALDSIVNQTSGDWELVVVENGSTDESPGILASYADPRIRIQWLRENIGRTPALRQAFDMARGEYFAVLDADDVSHPERLATQVAYLDAHPDVVLVGTWALLIDEQGEVLDRLAPTTDARQLYENLGWANPIVHSSVMYRAGVASELGGYSEDLPYAQDYGLWLRLAQRGEVAMIAEYLCEQRVRSNGLTQGKGSRIDVARDCVALHRYARRHLALERNALRRNRDEIMIAEVKYGVALIRNRRPVAGCHAIGLALLRNPLGLLCNRVIRRQFSK
jgi:glycosyltransferase involved in cell wall biosynthesis